MSLYTRADDLRILMDELLLCVSKHDHISTNGIKFTQSSRYAHTITLDCWGTRYYIQFTQTTFGVYRHDPNFPSRPDALYMFILGDSTITSVNEILAGNVVKELFKIRNEMQRITTLAKPSNN